MEQQQQRRPKSIKQIRAMRKKQPKLIEPAKKTLIIRGNKTSDFTNKLMKDIKTLKKAGTTYFSRRHDTHPFESVSQIEKYCKNTQSSLFLFGSNSKKRPNNIVLGRMYEYELLDMVELGLLELVSIDEFQNPLDIPVNSRPFLIFQGDLWETDANLIKIKNIFQDFFVENVEVPELDLNNAIRLVITFTAHQDRIYMRTYDVHVTGENLLEGEGKLSIEETGPKADFIVRRSRLADDEKWKEATKKPKVITKKSQKNINHDSLGNKRGKVFVDTQNFQNLPLKKRKALKENKLKNKLEERESRLQEFQA